jgi:hypothetical protein
LLAAVATAHAFYLQIDFFGTFLQTLFRPPMPGKLTQPFLTSRLRFA